MKLSELEKLNKVVASGKWPFVLKQGVVGWGLTTAVLFSAIMAFFNGASFFEGLPSALVTFGIGGIFWGLFMWYFLNRRIKHLERQVG